ncbi:MAG: acyl-CoA dehydrogenase family protein [Bacteroidales bacterium]|jgi:alkylation response protein AidB-like acyl-CoA dehydrogenase|nr:acyl-CoA dehydrogenase family protein [Bacteroidales bacterium]
MANFFLDNEHLKFHLTHPLMRRIVQMKENDYTETHSCDTAPVDFEDAMDTYEQVLEIIGEICGDIIAPNAESVDEEGPKLVCNEVMYARGTQQNHEALINAGVYGISLPRKYNGLNFPMIPYVIANELISRADSSFANIWGLQDCAETIYEFASEELKDKYLPMINQGYTCSMDLTEPDAGSDLQAVQLKATFDEESNCWRLNGVKRFITNGDADVKLVLARSEEGTKDARGLSYFLYDRKDKGVSIRRIENKLGIKGSPTCELVFNNAPAQLLGERRMGLIKYVMTLMNGARLGIGAQSVGIAEAAYREAEKYAGEREQFGKAILKFPAVFELLANMRAKINAIRSLLYETSRFVDMQKLFEDKARTRILTQEERNEMKYFQRLADVYTPMLKLVSSEYCNQITYDAIQIHGGTGFMKDFPVERLYRDARITSIYEGTSQLQVVAAIRGVGSGVFLNKIKEYETESIKSEFQPLKEQLVDMTCRYEKIIEQAKGYGNSEMYDLVARRLVECIANIIMGYLLILDANRNDAYAHSAQIFISMTNAQNREKEAFIHSFSEKGLESYKTLAGLSLS